MIVHTGFDPDQQKMMLSITSNLISRYYPNFVGMVKNGKGVPKDISIERREIDTAIVAFSIDKTQVQTEQVNENMSKSLVAVDRNLMNSIFHAIDRFINAGLRKELKSTEFLPLYGYDLEELKKDVKTAISNGRNFCIIKDYSEYLEQEKKHDYVYNQYMIKTDNPEYADVAILIESGNMKELRKIYKPKLEKVCWF